MLGKWMDRKVSFLGKFEEKRSTWKDLPWTVGPTWSCPDTDVYFLSLPPFSNYLTFPEA